jgi:Tfp pilus assembly protein PilO
MRLSDFNVEQPDEEELGAGRIAVDGEGPTESLDVTVRGVGTYASFRTFVEGVERSLRIMDLVELSIEDSETGIYSYDMTFRIYWLR